MLIETGLGANVAYGGTSFLYCAAGGPLRCKMGGGFLHRPSQASDLAGLEAFGDADAVEPRIGGEDVGGQVRIVRVQERALMKRKISSERVSVSCSRGPYSNGLGFKQTAVMDRHLGTYNETFKSSGDGTGDGKTFKTGTCQKRETF
jgi:hypothetical protein